MTPTADVYDLKGALERACHPMVAWLDPEYGYHPTLGYEVAHDTGRWWGAAPRLEQTVGWTIPPEIEEAMRRNIRERTDNPDAMLLTSDRFPKNRARVNPHNLRETMLAYDALVRHRDCDWARAAGHRFLETLDRCLLPNGHLDRMALGIAAGLPMSDDGSLAEREDPDGWFDATPTTGRAVEPIVQFYCATGDALALHVATRLAEDHLARMVDDDLMAIERFWAPNNHGHNHSYLGTLRGLLLYGLVTGQENYVRAVSNVYRHSIWEHNIEWGAWTPHDLGLPAVRRKEMGEEAVGEAGSSADIVQLALWLALHDHQAELFADIEKIIRLDHIGRQVGEWDLGVVREDGRTITDRWLLREVKGKLLRQIVALHNLADN